MENSLDEFLSAHKLPLAMGFVGLVLLIGGVISSGIIPKTFIKSTKSGTGISQASVVSNPSEVKVDVSGAVINPGVYTLSSSARVEDALKAAGGVKDSADPAFVSKSINLAQKVSDGMKVFIPEVGSTSSPQAGFGQASAREVASVSSQNSLVNINSALLAELDKLPGVGPVGAQKIIDGRPYGSIEELFTKKAVTRSVYEKIKELVSVW